MKFSLRNNSSGGAVGLDIDGRYLAAAQVESGRVVRGVSLELPAGLVADGEVVNRDGLAEALKNFVAEAGLPKGVRLGVTNQQIVVRVVELPRIEDEKQRDAAVRFQAAEAIAMPLDDAVLDHQVAGYSDAPEDTARVYCHLGGVSNLAIAVGSTCFFTRPLSAVWDDEDAGAHLADEVRLSIDYYMTQPQAKPVGEVVLSGPGSAEPQLPESLETHLGIPVQVPAPLGAIDGSSLAPNEDPNRYTVAAGLSLGAAA